MRSQLRELAHICVDEMGTAAFSGTHMGVCQDRAVCNVFCLSYGVTVFPEWWLLEKSNVRAFIAFPMWGARL